MSVKLENLGWNEFFESERTKLGLDGFPVARVIVEYKGAYKVKNENGEFLAKIIGKQIFKATSREDYPAVGDWVTLSGLNNGQAAIQTIFPRKSIIKRRFGDRNRIGEKSDVQIIAANIDVAFIVQSVGRDYNINRFERYLAIIKDSDIKPAIILNKIDLILAEEVVSRIAEIKNRLDGIDVIPTSIVNSEGLDKLSNYIEKGKTYCFLGSSGVGKSSLINKLLGKDDIKTGDVSSYSGRGRHVTTGREMYFLPARRSLGAGGEFGGIVIDNPGIREVGLTDVGAGVSSLFDEISKLAQKCKYADCTHIHEPGCAVLAAVEDGTLDKDRYQNYIRLQKETQYFEMSEVEKKEKNRDFGRFMKKAKKSLKNSKHKYF